ncbi:MAG TPA: GntR family transcriptional regulator [Allosphingosinicella sp.]|jgi:DNA-binding GntR family transcriptional regulator
MQLRSTTLVRGNISDELVNQLRNMIVDGSLAAGERINEVHLSRALGVSRTPLREALVRLGREGTLASVPRIGWFVKPLTLEEFEQIYPLRALLDPEALRLAGLPPRETVDRLERLNARIGSATDADETIALDDEWHLALIGHCPNEVLLDLVREFIRRTRRYEIALMRERANVAVATGNHLDIMAALRRRDLEGAVEGLRRNLTTGLGPIRAWLEAREREAK